jgi:hypothetical protein
VQKMVRSSIVHLVQIGQIWMAASLLFYGVTYFLFSPEKYPLEIRQLWVRPALFLVLVAIDLWSAILLIRGKNL